MVSNGRAALTGLRRAVDGADSILVLLEALLNVCRTHRADYREAGNDPDVRNAERAALREAFATFSEIGRTTLTESDRASILEICHSHRDIPPVCVARALAGGLEDALGHLVLAALRRRGTGLAAGGIIPAPRQLFNKSGLTTSEDHLPAAEAPDRLKSLRLAPDCDGLELILDYSLYEALRGSTLETMRFATAHLTGDFESSFHRDVNTKAKTFFNVHPHTDDQDLILKLISEARLAETDILVFPELSLTEALALRVVEELRRRPSPPLVVLGSYHVARTEGKMNEALVLAGDVLATHQKIEPLTVFSGALKGFREDLHQPAVPTLRLFVTENFTFSVLICRDLLSADVQECLSRAGVGLVLVPAMCDKLSSLASAAATVTSRTQAFVVVANDPMTFDADRGRALVIQPLRDTGTVWLSAEEAATECGLWTFRSFDTKGKWTAVEDDVK
jgi:predicted amidohydrolase